MSTLTMEEVIALEVETILFLTEDESKDVVVIMGYIRDHAYNIQFALNNTAGENT